jgi:uncharacterized protein (UPF0332 family)
MGREEVISDIQDFLVGVEEELRSFVANYNADIPRKCVVNLYYAYLHTVRALLATKGIYPKTHEGVERMFSLHFIKSKRFESKFGVYFSNLHSRREEADYKKHLRFDMSWIKGLQEWVLEFIPIAIQYIKEEYPEIDITNIEISFDKFSRTIKK